MRTNQGQDWYEGDKRLRANLYEDNDKKQTLGIHVVLDLSYLHTYVMARLRGDVRVAILGIMSTALSDCQPLDKKHLADSTLSLFAASGSDRQLNLVLVSQTH